jgi:enoyl-CoA hydratase/carnithine racemase
MQRLVRGSLNYSFSQFVKLTRYEGAFDKVAKLELDNPKKKNALSVDLLNQVISK